MGRHMTFTLACVVALSAVVPGVAGYLSARFEAVEAAERSLHATEMRLNARMARESRHARPVSFPAPCEQSTISGQVPQTLFAQSPETKQHRKHERLPVAPPPAWLQNSTAD
ncbi:hypothetical protein ACIBHX_36730 [Nonomuraea sp. NPDC050536]|uniref:hypothetical protein n=1 Tax=Nonomuraea sp. NPDC050536 TaxID=3364366 RepID=UPI0037CA36B9